VLCQNWFSFIGLERVGLRAGADKPGVVGVGQAKRDFLLAM